MPNDGARDDPREEYAALVRAVAAHVELEASFGIEAAKLPPPPAAPAAAQAPQPPQPRHAKPRPAPPPPPPPQTPPAEAAKPRHITTPTTAHDMFGPKEYNIQIPDGLSKQEQLDFLADAIKDCTLCRLHEGRTQVVFGVGNPDAELMFVGEAPGRDEDAQGEPFVGRAGQLLTRIIEAMGIKREDVYIANVNKCRPPNNRAPMPDEMATCVPFLHRQIEIIQPRIICLLGATAVRGLLQEKTGITKLRGRSREGSGSGGMPRYDPAHLRRNPGGKRDGWSDVQKIRDALLGT